MTVVGDDDQVLDPDPELARDVDAGLDRDHVAGLEHVLRALAQPRRLVDLEPDAVAEPVAEVVLVAALADHRPRGLVGLLAADPGADRVEAGRLRGARRARRPRRASSPISPTAKVRVQSEQ